MGIFLEGVDSRGDHGLGRLVEFRFKAPPNTTSSSITTHTPSGQRNCASWASQPQKSVTLLPCAGGRTTKSTKRTCGGIGKKKSQWYMSYRFAVTHPLGHIGPVTGSLHIYCLPTVTMVARTHLTVYVMRILLVEIFFALPTPCVCKCYQRPYIPMLPRELISNVNLSIPRQSKCQPHSGV